MSIASLVAYKDTSLTGELEEVAAFFGLKASGAEMARLTGTQRSSLSRAMGGSRPRSAEHIGVLASFVRTARAAIEERTGQPPTPYGMRAWLYSGSVMTASRGLMTPIDALSDPTLAKEALAEMEKERAEWLGVAVAPVPPPVPTEDAVAIGE